MTTYPALFNDYQQLEDIFNHAAIGIARVGLDGSWLSVNQKICSILGYSQKSLRQLTFQDITHPDDLEIDLHLVNEVIAGKRESYRLEKRYFHKSGNIIWANLTVSLVKNEAGKPSYFIAVIEDITNRKKIQLELRKEKRFIDRTINSSLAGIYIYNISTGNNEYINETYTSLTGYTMEDLNALTAEEFGALFHPDERGAVFQHMDDVINATDDSYFEIEYRFQKKDGTWLWCLSRDRVFSWNEQDRAESFIGTFIDVTQKKRLEQQLNKQSRHDFLTGAYNRRGLTDKLDHEIKRSRRYQSDLSLMIIDIDHFKQINDQYGHQKGDEILIHFAELAKSILRDSDILARYGGDEFVIILPAESLDKATKTAWRLHDQFSQSVRDKFSDNISVITISIGVAQISHNTDTIDKLFHRADEALYQAKECGRNTVVPAS